MSSQSIGLGTQLRHLLERLDGDVERGYRALGLAYRPRYTPAMVVLARQPTASVREVAEAAGITHSAASQTLRQMQLAGLVESTAADDGREHRLRLSARGRRLLPTLRTQWAATRRAADELDAELPYPLSLLLAAAIDAVERRPFFERVAAARGDESAAAPRARRARR